MLTGEKKLLDPFGNTDFPLEYNHPIRLCVNDVMVTPSCLVNWYPLDKDGVIWNTQICSLLTSTLVKSLMNCYLTLLLSFPLCLLQTD